MKDIADPYPGNGWKTRKNFKKAEQFLPKFFNLGPWMLTEVLPPQKHSLIIE